MTPSSAHSRQHEQLAALEQPLIQQAGSMLARDYPQLDLPPVHQALAQLYQQLSCCLSRQHAPSNPFFSAELIHRLIENNTSLTTAVSLLKQLRSLYLEQAAAQLDPKFFTSSLQQRVIHCFDRLELACCEHIDLVEHSCAIKRLHHPLFNNSHSMMLLIDPDTGEIVDANPAACAYYGYSYPQMVGRNIATINTLSADEILQQMQRAREHNRHCYHFRHRLADQQIRDVEVYTGPLVLDGRTLLYSIIYDISERLEIEEHLHKVMAAVDHSPSSIIITDSNGQIEYVNQSFCELTGFSPEEVLGCNPRMFQGSAMPTTKVKELWQTIQQGRVWRGIFHNRKKNGELFWERAAIAPVRNRNDQISHFVAIKEDITQQKRLEEKIWHQAHHDALTDLPNRFLVNQHIEEVMQHSRRQDSGAALLFIDLDGFKQINDSWGHDSGDHLLQQVARRLLHTVRQTDIVARQGGDEFIIILQHTKGLQAAQHAALKVLSQLQQPFDLNGHTATITGSIGLAMFCDHTHSETLVKQADRAMFDAKHLGRNRLVIARPT